MVVQLHFLLFDEFQYFCFVSIAVFNLREAIKVSFETLFYFIHFGLDLHGRDKWFESY